MTPDSILRTEATYAAINDVAQACHLEILGAFHPCAEDDGGSTLILLGPHEPGFWAAITTTAEFNDGRPNPLDRWSRRIVDALAQRFGGQPRYPFGGPPYHPFIDWAQQSGHVFVSPVGLLVHHRAGLFVSFRGALLIPQQIDLPPRATSPCPSCPRPCISACPVGALTENAYDIAACRHHIMNPPGRDCSQQGCQVRNACPISARYGRDPAQSAFHMRAFAQQNPPSPLNPQNPQA